MDGHISGERVSEYLACLDQGNMMFSNAISFRVFHYETSSSSDFIRPKLI